MNTVTQKMKLRQSIIIVNDIIFYTFINNRLTVGAFRWPPHPFGHHSK